MAKYVRDMAQIFDGFRLDNCHSTPLPVLEFLMREAKETRSTNLYVMAELFTNSHARDMEYINRVGINSLLREIQSVNSTFLRSHTSHL